MQTAQGATTKQSAAAPTKRVDIRSIVDAPTVKADFRVCCNHKESSISCAATMNAIMKNFNNIVKIQTAKPYDDTEDMCVIGTAIIKPSMRSRFEEDLKTKIRKSNPSIKIKRAIVTLYQ